MPSADSQYKTHIPHTPGAIERPRLLQRMSAALEHKLTLVSAPPGYGKTTIASQFAYQIPHPVVWHIIEERERDVPNLYHHALAALEQVVPITQSPREVQNYTPAELAAVIADHLRAVSPRKIVYVLDDAQHLTGSAAAEAWLRSLVALLPSNCHLILISRVFPRLSYAEMLARREVLAIGQEELRMTVDEANSLAFKMPGDAPSPEKVEEFVTRLEGWPAGIVLALQPLPPDLERAMLGGGEGPEALFDALAESMLGAQPSGLRDFLLASSTLTRMTPELCSAALGLSDSANRLAEAQMRNLFLSKVPGGLMYHSLFRTFLQQQLQSRDPEHFAELHTRAGRWFEDKGEIDEAFAHYMAADLPDRAAALAERVAAAYFAQGKMQTLLSWGTLLRQVGVVTPRLSYMCARFHIDHYEYEAAESELAEAETGFMEREDEIGIADVQLQRAVITLQQGQYQEAVARVTHLMQFLPDAANLRGRAMRILGVALLLLGDAESGVTYLEQALPLYRNDGDRSALSFLLQDLQAAYGRLGRLDESGACLQEMVALRRSLGGAGTLTLALNNLGYYYHQRGDYTQAMATFREGLSVVTRVSDRRAESYLLWSMGDLQRDLGDFDQAIQLYTRALELHGESEPLLRLSILISASVLQRWQGHWQEALSLAQEALKLAEKHSLPSEGAIARVAMWAARARMDKADSIMSRMAEAVGDLEKQGARFEMLGILGVQAEVALLLSDEATAEAALDAALSLAREVGSAQPLAAEVAHTPFLETFVIARRKKYQEIIRDLDLLRAVQKRLTHAAQGRSHSMTDATYSLRVWTLGQERIERDGRLVPLSEWRAVAARELFLYLLFHGPETRERISLVFWPDSSTQRVRSSFHTTLYRARQALGEDVINFHDNRYLINPEIDLWCDALELEALVNQARLLPARDARAEDLWHKASELYQGDFLPSFESEWVYPHREMLLETYLETLMGLSECARARNDFTGALRSLRHALDIDPFREDVHRAIMICYARMGEKQRIRAHLEKLRRLLAQELSTAPSEETLGLASLLLS